MIGKGNTEYKKHNIGNCLMETNPDLKFCYEDMQEYHVCLLSLEYNKKGLLID